MLNEDEDSRADLRQFFDDVRAYLTLNPSAPLPETILPMLRTLQARWYLPREQGTHDLWGTLQQVWLVGRDQLRLLPGRYRRMSGDETTAPPRHDIVPPNCDPTQHSRLTVRAEIAQRMEDLDARFLRDVEDLQRQAREGRWLRDRETLDHPDAALRAAERFYRWNILRWTWRRIAERESEECPERGTVNWETIRTSTRQWARAFAVPLRQGSPGRPPKTR